MKKVFEMKVDKVFSDFEVHLNQEQMTDLTLQLILAKNEKGSGKVTVLFDKDGNPHVFLEEDEVK